MRRAIRYAVTSPVTPSLLLLFATAFAPARAEEPARERNSVAARVEGSVGIGPASGVPAAGLGLVAGVPAGRTVIEADLGLGADALLSPIVTGFLGARVRLGPDARRQGLALTGAVGGGWWRAEPHPLARVGVAYDLPMRDTSALRLALAWQGGGGGAGAVVAGIGVVWRGADEVASIAAVPTIVPAVPTAPLLLTVDPPEALIWVPHPVCDWIPASQLAEVLPAGGADVVLQVRATGFLPTEILYTPGGEAQTISLRPAPVSGAVVVVAYPGDRLFIEKKAFPIAPDGTAVFGAAEGPVQVEVVGGGRRVVLDGVVAGGYALWLRAPDPLPLVVSFPPGSSVIPAEALPLVQAFAAAVGEHELRVVGYYGTEEGQESRRLGSTRAESLAAALLAAGVSIENVKVLSSSRPPENLSPEEQRSARIEILPPDRRR